MADNYALREGTGKLTKFRSVELEGGLHLLIAGLADAEGNLLGTTSAPLPVSVEGGITIGDITLSNVEISNDVGNPVPVVGAVSSNSVVSSATITRPADTTAYVAKDVVSTLAGAVIEFTGMALANAGTGTIVRARLMTSQKTNVALYRLHLFHTAPSPIADNSPYLLLYANAANRIGSIDFPALSTEDPTNSTSAASMRPSYDGSYNAPNLWYKCKSDGTSLYGILETLSAFTPDSAQTYFIELGADGLS